MKAILAAATAAMVFTTPLAAQSFDEDRQLEVFTRDDLKATLTQLGATYQESADQPNIDVEFTNGFKADAVLMACDDQASETNCFGTSILATFSRSDDTTDAAVLAAINMYNFNENFGRAYVDDDGTISLRMYIISDGGVTMEHYRRQIQLFVASAEDFFGYLYGDE